MDCFALGGVALTEALVNDIELGVECAVAAVFVDFLNAAVAGCVAALQWTLVAAGVGVV